MRWIAILCLVCFTVACSDPDESPKTTENVETTIRLTPLATPLPGDVLPDFPYDKVVDMTNPQPQMTTRSVSLQVPMLNADDALNALGAKWIAAGFQKTEKSVDDKGTISQSFSSGGDGGGLTQVVASGGTFVTVIARNFDPEDESAKKGYQSFLMITVNSKGE